MSRDWLSDAQRAAEEHITNVWDYFHEAEQAETHEELEALWPDDPAFGPFCGCITCEVREILHGAMPVIAAGIIAGEIDPKDLIGE